MNYIRKLRRGTLNRSVKIVSGAESNPGYIVVTEDIETKDKVFLSPAPDVETPKWCRTEEDALTFAEGVVRSSLAEGFVLLESE
jgi:hypothetical protein